MDGRRLGSGLRSGIVGALVLLSPPLAAAPIEWEAPAGCPDTDALLASLRQALDTEVIALGEVSRARAVVVETAGATPRYRLTLELVEHERRSTRTFEAERCDDLARTAALAISLAIHEREAQSEPAPVSSAHADAPAPPAAAPELEPAPESGLAPALRWSAGANALLDVGALPEPALGVGLQARAALGSFELDLHASLLPTQRRVVGIGNAVELGLMAVGARGCLRWLDRALLMAGCVGLETGRFTAEAVGLIRGRQVHDLWLAAGPALVARTAFDGPLQLELLAEPLVPLARKRYAVNGTDVLHLPSAVDLRLQLGLVIGASNRASGE